MGLSPQPHVSEEERERGLRSLVFEAAFANAAGAVTSGVILTAFALHLGASNAVVGLLAAMPFIAQLLQAPAILLIERTRARKRWAVLSSLVGRSMLFLMAALAFWPGAAALGALLAAQAVFCAMGAVGSCAWNAWVRDLAPEERLGRLMARRTIYATGISLVAGLAAALLLDRSGGAVSRPAAFAGLYAFGAVAGLVSGWIVARMPEPLMPPPPQALRLIGLLAAPLRDINFRRLIAFLCSWQFAVNLATPFFTVFMVKQLGYSMTFVMSLAVASQLANVATLQSWGVLSDRFANKSVLAVAGPAYIACIAGMVGASQFDDRMWGGAYLLVLHVLMGAAVAGVTLASANIALKLSPKGAATAYIAANALLTSLAAGIAPILGGLFADFFASRRLEILLRWTAPDGALTLRPIAISNWDFYFLAAAVIGLYAVHRLSLVREKGEIERRAMIGEVLQQGRRAMRNVSSVAGLRAMTNLPGGLIRDIAVQARLRRARAANPPSPQPPSPQTSPAPRESAP